MGLHFQKIYSKPKFIGRLKGWESNYKSDSQSFKWCFDGSNQLIE